MIHASAQVPLGAHPRQNGPRSLRLDGHDVARGPLASLPHLAHEELRELAAPLEHRARRGVNHLRIGGLERRGSGHERTRTGIASGLILCTARRGSRNQAFYAGSSPVHPSLSVRPCGRTRFFRVLAGCTIADRGSLSPVEPVFRHER